MPQKPLIKAPPKASGQLRPGEKNRPLGKDYLADAIDLILGGIGVNDALDPEDVSTATSLGALSTAGLGGAGMALLKRLGGLRRTAPAAREALTLDNAAKFAANRQKVLGNAPSVTFKKAELPAEFQASGTEQDAYNTVRRNRQEMRKPKPSNHGDSMLARRTEGVVDDPIRTAREANAAAGKPSKLTQRRDDGERHADVGSPIKTIPISAPQIPVTSIPTIRPSELRGTALTDVPANMSTHARANLLDFDPDNLPIYDTIRQRAHGEEAHIPHQLYFGEDWRDEGGREFLAQFNKLNKVDKARMAHVDDAFDLDSRMRHGRAAESHNPRKQRLLPLSGNPLVSFDPNVFNTQEVEGLMQGLGRLHGNMKAADPAVPDLGDAVSNIYFRKEQGGAQIGGRGSVPSAIEAGTPGTYTNSTGNILGHEFRHAVDIKQQPKMFDDYPFDSLFGGSDYIKHPTEVRARATGNVHDFMEKSRETGQLTFPIDYLEEMDNPWQQLFGELSGDKTKLSNKVGFRPSPRYTLQPSQQDIPGTRIGNSDLAGGEPFFFSDPEEALITQLLKRR